MHSTSVSALFNVWYSFKRCAFPYECCGHIWPTGVSLEYSHYLGAEPCLQYFQQVAVLLCYFMWWVLWGDLNRSVLGLTSWGKPCQHLAMDLLLFWEYGEMAKETRYRHVLGSCIWRNTQNKLCTCVLPFGSQKYRRGFTSFYISCNCKGHLSTSYFSYCPKMACCTFDFLIFLSSAPPLHSFMFSATSLCLLALQ